MCRALTLTALATVALALAPATAAQAGTPYGPAPAASQAGTPMVDPTMTSQKISFWRALRKVVVCVAAIGAFVGGNGLLIWKLRKAGGVWKSAKRVLRAKGNAAKVKLLTGIFGEVLGLDTIAEKC